MRFFKIFISSGILLCLFLPLAHCDSQSAEETHGDEIAIPMSIEEMHELDKQNSGDRVLIFVKDSSDLSNWAIYTFLLPLLLCFPFKKPGLQLASLILQTLTVLWFCWVISVINSWWPIFMWGGYLFIALVCIYTLVTIIEWVYVFKKRQSTILIN